MIEPVILKAGDNASLTLFGAMVLEEIIWADAYDATRPFALDELLNYDGKSWRLLTPAKQYFRNKEIYDHGRQFLGYQGTDSTDSEVLLEWSDLMQTPSSNSRQSKPE